MWKSMLRRCGLPKLELQYVSEMHSVLRIVGSRLVVGEGCQLMKSSVLQWTNPKVERAEEDFQERLQETDQQSHAVLIQCTPYSYPLYSYCKVLDHMVYPLDYGREHPTLAHFALPVHVRLACLSVNQHTACSSFSVKGAEERSGHCLKYE